MECPEIRHLGLTAIQCNALHLHVNKIWLFMFHHSQFC